MFDSVAIDDLNDDGIPDVAIARTRINGPPPHPGHVLVKFQDLLNQGTFSPAVKFPVGHDPLAVATDDINGDGLTDLVTANSSDDNISVLLQDQAVPGNFLAANNFITGNYPNDVAIGDIDGDALMDIAVADSELSILYQDPASIGNFLPRTSLGVGSGSVAISDLDDDLFADLATTRGVVSIHLQDPAAPENFLPAVEYTAGDQPTHVAIGDLDGDTLPDLAVANLGEPDGGGNRGVSVLLQDPATPGTFLSAIDYVMGDRVYEVAIGDLNDDGIPDLAVAGRKATDVNGDLDFEDARVYVLFQDPATPGSFFPPVSYKLDGFSNNSVAIGDLNEDTFNDILAATSDKVYILFQDSANPGTFLRQTIHKD
ncbi:MAG: VCBS repeat-containing protein [Deltaproteobacteria bacterium]|nr:MAG: VCBS repeat-containing protein [Deltaproteobacteria bacterium]